MKFTLDTTGRRLCGVCARGNWTMFLCPEFPEEMLPRMTDTEKAICANCLGKKIADGALLVTTPERVESLMKTETTLTEEAQVIVTEDGTMINEGTQFDWGT